MQDEVRPAPRYLTFGKCQEGRESTREDFKDAEWHGEEELSEQDGN
jgi:hypothetical protein